LLSTRRVDFAIGRNWFSRRRYTRDGQRFIAISSAVRDALLAGGVRADRIDLVFSGVSVERVTGGDGKRLRHDWLMGDKTGPVIGFLGALVDHKAPWILAEALPLIRQELPHAVAVFVGDGPELGRLQSIASTMPPGAIQLAGWRDDVADCYAAFDLFVMPSKLEGLCTALVDALAAGVPAIASRAGGIPDVLADGGCGELVPPLDPAALATAVVRLWRDPERRKAVTDAGRQRVATQFTADAMVEGTIRSYQNLLSVPGRSTQD
jgi:glycosyltransferase involved in cell wall biosynthesis